MDSFKVILGIYIKPTYPICELVCTGRLLSLNIMEVIEMEIAILILGIFLFFIIYFSVRLAINPLLKKQVEPILNDNNFGLIKLNDIETLSDMEVLSDKELDEVIKMYQNQDKNRKNSEKYNKYSKVLNDLKEKKYFDDEQYLIRLNKLKDYYKVK